MTNADRIALGHEMTEARQGAMHVMVKDRRCHVCYCPVPGTDWSLAMVSPDVEMLLGFNHLGYAIILILRLGFVGMAWLCRIVVHQTIFPINRLLTYTQNIADGNYNEMIPRTKKTDVIGQLQNGFATMQEALRSHMGSICRTAEELKKRNEQRARDMALAEETVKKKALFIQNLSHQMRTPLNIISGFAQVLTDPDFGVSADERRSIANAMTHNTNVITTMIDEVLELSYGDDLREGTIFKQVRCNELLQSTVEEFCKNNSKANKLLTFDSQLDDTFTMQTQESMIKRIVLQLLDNAFKNLPKKDGRIVLRATATTSHLSVIVEDNGRGIPAEKAEEIFERFYKLDTFKEGLGIGLTFSRTLAKRLGGNVYLDTSYEGPGARFVLTIPLLSAKS